MAPKIFFLYKNTVDSGPAKENFLVLPLAMHALIVFHDLCLGRIVDAFTCFLLQIVKLTLYFGNI